eukprot:gene21994-1280_t
MTMQGGIACECCWVLVNWGGVHRGSVPKPYLDILPAGGKADLLCRSKTAVDYDASTKHEDPNRSVDVAAAGDEDTSDDKPMEEDLAKMTLGSDFDMDREYLWLDELPDASARVPHSKEATDPNRARYYVLLTFEQPLTTPAGCTLIGSRLDQEAIVSRVCRLAFHGKLVKVFKSHAEEEWRAIRPEVFPIHVEVRPKGHLGQVLLHGLIIARVLVTSSSNVHAAVGVFVLGGRIIINSSLASTQEIRLATSWEYIEIWFGDRPSMHSSPIYQDPAALTCYTALHSHR